MKMVKGLTLMAIGASLVLAYQKYNEPLMNAVKRAARRNDAKCAFNDELEDMM